MFLSIGNVAPSFSLNLIKSLHYHCIAFDQIIIALAFRNTTALYAHKFSLQKMFRRQLGSRYFFVQI